MNAAPQLPHDYRSQMQAQALSYLQAHQAEHLADDAQLIERTTSHLVHYHDVPLFLAPAPGRAGHHRAAALPARVVRHRPGQRAG